jgi:Xaa-Pro aminopeptidase
VAGFPGRVVPYSRWEELHAALGSIVAGRRLAMEVSPEDAVPYLDRVPAGVVELIRRLGGTVVPSAPLVSRFASGWTEAEAADHRFAAEVLAEVAREALSRAVREAGAGLTETALQGRVVAAVEARGLVFDTLPIVGFGANSANPHYEPHAGVDATLRPGDVVLLDLWAGRSRTTVFADQTWMGFAGERPPEQVTRVWDVVRAARDAAVAAVQGAAGANRPIAGFEADRAARGVIEAAGFGDRFVHRTGHSIDRDLHGSGPHLDDYETHDDRRLIPGIGFSVEPGIYLPGEFGVRSEVNMHWGAAGPEVTPRVPQTDLIAVSGER